MSAMINLEIPHINVMSKMDLLPKMKASELERCVFLVVNDVMIRPTSCKNSTLISTDQEFF